MKYVWFFVAVFVAPVVCAQNVTKTTEARPAKPDSLRKHETAYLIVEQDAQYKNGMRSFYQEYIYPNLEHPQEARIDGRVYVKFVVSSDGWIYPQNVRIERSLNPACDSAVLNIIRKSPQWQPARQGGKAVAQQMTLSVQF